jgi:hypothetical protein
MAETRKVNQLAENGGGTAGAQDRTRCGHVRAERVATAELDVQALTGGADCIRIRCDARLV